MRHDARIPRRQTNLAFGLIELLVTLAIIGTLAALFLPALQAVREASRRTECKNHLKQIALGFQLHHESIGHLPTGGWGFRWVGDPDRGFGLRQPGGWIYNVLPFVEQGQLHDSGLGLPNYSSGKWQAATRMLQVPVPLFTCPSRRESRSWPVREIRDWMFNANKPVIAEGWTRSCYAANLGEQEAPWIEGPNTLAMGDANLGFFDMSKVTGISCQHRLFRLVDVTDGLAHTYLVGEKGMDPQHYFTGLDASDDEPMLSGASADLHATSSRTPSNDTPGKSFRYAWGSAHPGFVQMAYCDGSIHNVPIGIDPIVHRRLGNRRDNEAVDISQL